MAVEIVWPFYLMLPIYCMAPIYYNIDSIKSYGRENLCLKPEWDAPILNDQERKKKISIQWNGKKCQECISRSYGKTLLLR